MLPHVIQWLEGKVLRAARLRSVGMRNVFQRDTGHASVLGIARREDQLAGGIEYEELRRIEIDSQSSAVLQRVNAVRECNPARSGEIHMDVTFHVDFAWM